MLKKCKLKIMMYLLGQLKEKRQKRNSWICAIFYYYQRRQEGNSKRKMKYLFFKKARS